VASVAHWSKNKTDLRNTFWWPVLGDKREISQNFVCLILVAIVIYKNNTTTQFSRQNQPGVI